MVAPFPEVVYSQGAGLRGSSGGPLVNTEVEELGRGPGKAGKEVVKCEYPGAQRGG